ncbi:hypothetical protein B0T26DRAFT_673571 [Lasiosphaeria miniovina]|uniref:Uncharacterized protein n=1 Tax=Lasiosphaeria miniovina TaxID=1954250 RepID=A0AA40ATK9_9PEZI|nr:uncharacterized protein B0T26DRAFT_673571 [Lasiosphaeria miniovina]KAK0721786.1 hypothetical protein B0T26DRAFT_673571 [Lasiosphaeria miniovina]
MSKRESISDETLAADPREPHAPSNLTAQPKFQFIYLENGDGVGFETSKKTVRSYAAKKSHAQTRREQMMKHQQAQRREAEQSAAEPASRLQRGQSTAVALQGTSSLVRPASPVTLLSAAPIDPFASAARPISKFEYCLLDHVIHVVARRSNFSTPSFPTPETYWQGLRTQWVPLALTDPGMLDGLLTPACRSLHSLYGDGRSAYWTCALSYKTACIVSLSQAISREGNNPRDSTIAKAVILAGDEASIGDLLSAKQHIDAALQMVALRGGRAMLGTNGFLAGLIDVFSSDQSTE